MKIIVRPLKGDNFEVEVEGDAKVEDFKKKIAEAKPQFPAEQQNLIYAGRILVDTTSVQDVGIKEGEFVVVMVKKVKPPEAAAPAPTPAPAPVAPAAAPTPSPPAGGDAPMSMDQAASALVGGSGMEGTIQQLCDMGFERSQVETCLRAAFNNPDRAVEYLMSGIPEGVLEPAGAPPPAAGGGAPSPVMGGGGGASPFPAMGGGGGGGGGGGAAPTGDAAGALAELRADPRFPEFARMIAQNPQMLAQILPVLQQSFPSLVQMIAENPEAFRNALQEAAAPAGQDPMAAMLAAAQGTQGGGDQGGIPPGAAVVRLSDAERQAVERLAALGFDPQQALEAYLACDKNEELAANFLFDSGDTGM
eukprot:TRINITY_DN3765_c0_g1_i1.p1 TRINITY_DN3765_c0_g1~~TRINITY_DN3765_c0_g1_i1.p1  ORF type:complete len:362 (-),score=107.84 TRINITY_DN3765_c0_g1_i1:286-1371(-)